MGHKEDNASQYLVEAASCRVLLAGPELLQLSVQDVHQLLHEANGRTDIAGEHGAPRVECQLVGQVGCVLAASDLDVPAHRMAEDRRRGGQNLMLLVGGRSPELPHCVCAACLCTNTNEGLHHLQCANLLVLTKYSGYEKKNKTLHFPYCNYNGHQLVVSFITPPPEKKY